MQMLFFAYYFIAFFYYALSHIIATLVKPFNFTVISQIENLIASNLKGYLINFLYNIKTLKKLLKFTIPVITSSLLLNSYLLDMYYKLIVAVKY